ncbi:MAG: helix-turn-helix domain-containing protein [Nitrospinota bacterium]
MLPFCHITLRAKKPLPPIYPNSLNSLGDHIRKRRLDLDVLQREVAEILGVHATTVHGWERGRNHPSLPFLPKIVAFLGYVPWDGPPRNLGEKIARARKWLGISQEKLATEIGVDPGTLARRENGLAPPIKKSSAENQGMPLRELQPRKQRDRRRLKWTC